MKICFLLLLSFALSHCLWADDTTFLTVSFDEIKPKHYGLDCVVHTDPFQIATTKSMPPAGMITKTKDGMVFRGTLDKQDADSITISAAAGTRTDPNYRKTITIEKRLIKKTEIAEQKPLSEVDEKLKRDVASVNLKDGIDMQEAKILADSYRFKFGPGCGSLGPIREHKSYWEFTVYEGIAAEKGSPICVEKKSGRIWSNGRPELDPQQLWQDVPKPN